MRVLISAEGNHEPKGHHYMVVDGHGFLVDLSKVEGTLVDPVILRVEWGPMRDGNVPRDGGVITRRDGSQQAFWDMRLLEPYLAAYNLKKIELAKAATLALAPTCIIGPTVGKPVTPNVP